MSARLWTRSETRQWSALLFLASICVYAARVSLPICITQVAKEYNWTKSESGVVLACFFWGYASTQVPAGYLADRFGGDNVLLLNTFGWSVITLFTPLLFALAYSTAFPIALLVVVRLLLGFAQGFHFPSTASLCSSRLVSSEKSRVFGIVTAGSHVGTVVCGSLGSVILERFGWRCVMYFIGSLGLLWVFCVSRLRRWSRRGARRVRLQSDLGVDDADTSSLLHPEKGVGSNALIHARALGSQLFAHHELSVSPTKSSTKSGKHLENGPVSRSCSSVISQYSVPWRKLLRQPAFWAAFAAHYCGANAFYTLFSWLPSYFHETFPDAQGFIFNTVPHAVLAVVSLCVPALATRLIGAGTSVTFVRRLFECASLGCIAVCLFSVARVKNYDTALIVITVAMGSRGLHHGGVSVNVNDFAPDHTGLMNTAGAIPGFVGTYVAGHILERSHSWPMVFSITGVQCLVGMVIYALFSTGKQLI